VAVTVRPAYRRHGTALKGTRLRSHDVTTGRTIVAVFDHGEDFYTALIQVCRQHNIRQGYIPMFIAGLSNADIVGTCQRLENPAAPVWDKVQLTNVEALGGGTLAYDEANDTISPHIHITVGLKEHSATAHTSHLLDGTVQFLTELVIVEIEAPLMHRHRNPSLFDVPQLRLDSR
jgi:predicted DNA-binding protein with PD1-like motif